MAALSPAQLLGQNEEHLVRLSCGQRLHPAAAHALQRLQQAARAAGFELAVASGFRSFARQRMIWNGKLSGERPVHDEAGRALRLSELPVQQRLEAVLRYSALPGASRHHWGTEADVYDAAALPPGQAVQLIPAEVAPGGVFDPFHCWLDARIAAAESHGFYRPYAQDLGGTAPERWHLSYAPLADELAPRLRSEWLHSAWQRERPAPRLRAQVLRQLDGLLARYGPAAVCSPP